MIIYFLALIYLVEIVDKNSLNKCWYLIFLNTF